MKCRLVATLFIVVWDGEKPVVPSARMSLVKHKSGGGNVNHLHLFSKLYLFLWT